MKYLGKIKSAEFGTIRDMPFLFGLQLHFSIDGGGVDDGGMYTVNISDGCKWGNEMEKLRAFENIMLETNKILKHAKVNHISELVGKPVEVEIENRTFKSFRILVEVL